MAKKKADNQLSPNELKLNAGIDIIRNHPLFRRLDISITTARKDQLKKETSAVCYSDGYVLVNPYISNEPKEWAYIIAHCMLHLCFGHFESENMPGYFEDDVDGKKKWVENCDRDIWNFACDLFVTKFLMDIKFGTPVCMINDYSLFASDERKIYENLLQKGISVYSNKYGTAKVGESDMYWRESRYYRFSSQKNSYATEFAYAVSDSVHDVINEAGGGSVERKSIQNKSAEWFINHYPLLGGLASGFKIIEVGYGSKSALNNDISIAAIDVTEREIYVNSAANLSSEEWKFVLAHEYLHAGLQHHERCQGREPYLWNVACDFVINSWLKEMQVGVMPSSVLYDETLRDYSAEEIYDVIVKNLKKKSKYETLRGYGKGDILDKGFAESRIKPVSLDDFCKNALRSGLEYHVRNGRGLIPSGLIEEIRALSIPPIPWDVQLAEWFNIHFAPIEKRRSYARPSRRQNSTPDIPRPSWITAEIPENSRTYGVIIDTSGSMSAKMIGIALGATASYSVEKDVPLVRVVFCDAMPYDIGYVSPEDIAGRVEVKGRGGTVLQPAIELLENAEDFPKNAPILIITDGYIEDNLSVHHEHAFLIPSGNYLPFRAKGKVFYFKE